MNMFAGIRAERLIAKRYERDGYAVTMEPPPSAIPFSLGNYRPDILASKGGENLLIEVKGSGARVDPQVYLSVDREVQRHPGWKFLLVTISDEERQELAPSASSPASVEAIKRRLEQLDPCLMKIWRRICFCLPCGSHMWLRFGFLLRAKVSLQRILGTSALLIEPTPMVLLQSKNTRQRSVFCSCEMTPYIR
jgi:hypothetical protein